MATVVVFGGTGYTGDNIVREAAARGHQVVAALSPRGDMAGRLVEVYAELDWVFVSPAGTYGAWVPGEHTGAHRVSGEVALFDAEGGSNISGADFADAVVDEIERPAHHREHIGVAY